MPDYMSRQRNGWRYQRAVPRDLQQLVGLKVWSTYLGQIGHADALAKARALASQHDGLIARLRALSTEERDAIVKAGGATEFDQNTRLAGALANFQSAPFLGRADLLPDPELPEDDQARDALWILTAKAEADAAQRDASQLRAISAKLSTAPARGTLLAYVDTWERVRQPRHKRARERMERYVRAFVDVVGNIPITAVKQADVIRFRDWLAKPERRFSESNQTKHLDSVRALLSVAVDEGLIPANPATGVRVRKARVPHAQRVRRASYTPSEVRLILDRLDELPPRRGASEARRESIKWAVRLAVYHGARIGEIAQLRKVDVRQIGGIWCLDFNDLDGKTIKNEASVRVVPLHPACIDFVDFVGTIPGPWALDLADYAEGGRAGWLSKRFPEYRARLGLGGTLHSLRHTWIDAARTVGMPLDVQWAITGHKGPGVHADYGSGPGLKALAEWLGKVDPAKP